MRRAARLAIVAMFIVSAVSCTPDANSSSTRGPRPPDEGAISPSGSPSAFVSPKHSRIAWSAQFGPASGEGVPAIAVSPDGKRAYVTGSARAERGTDFATIAYDTSTGDALWVARFDGGRFDNPTSLVASTDGKHVYVTGQSRGASSGDNITLGYQAKTGRQLWDAQVEGSFLPCCIVADPAQSKLFVTGAGGSPLEYRTVAIDGKAGAVLWSAVFTDPGAQLASAQSIDVSADGQRLFVGDSSQYPEDQPPGFRSVVVAYDTASGSTLWRTPYPGVVQDLAADPEGDRFYVTGVFATLALDAANGRVLWQALHHVRVASYFSLAIDPGGRRLYATGKTTPGYANETTAFATSTGTTLWSIRGKVRPAETGAWISVSSDGRSVYVGGSVIDHDKEQFAVGASRAPTGMELWETAFGEPHRDQLPYAFAVSPDERLVFIAGRIGYQKAADFLTVAFSTV